MIAVIDTNVLISAFCTPKGTPGHILRKSGEVTYITSEEIIDEIIRVVRYPHIVQRYGITEDQITEFLMLIREKFTIVEVASDAKGATKDPNDDRFIACAVAANADYIVSGDKHLLSVKNFPAYSSFRLPIFLLSLEGNDPHSVL